MISMILVDDVGGSVTLLDLIYYKYCPSIDDCLNDCPFYDYFPSDYGKKVCWIICLESYETIRQGMREISEHGPQRIQVE